MALNDHVSKALIGLTAVLVSAVIIMMLLPRDPRQAVLRGLQSNDEAAIERAADTVFEKFPEDEDLLKKLYLKCIDSTKCYIERIQERHLPLLLNELERHLNNDEAFKALEKPIQNIARFKFSKDSNNARKLFKWEKFFQENGKFLYRNSGEVIYYDLENRVGQYFLSVNAQAKIANVPEKNWEGLSKDQRKKALASAFGYSIEEWEKMEKSKFDFDSLINDKYRELIRADEKRWGNEYGSLREPDKKLESVDEDNRRN